MNVTLNLKSQGQKNEKSAGNDDQQAAHADLHEAPPVAVVEDVGLTEYQRQMTAEGRAAELTLGPYRIQDILGSGSFGQVFKAEHSIMKRMVALKVIVPDCADAEHWLLREVRAATRLIHPNIVLAYDANVVDGTLYYAMEYVDGMNLQELVVERGRLPVPFACAVMRQAALAFQCAHEKGMVHRDIKPANLLIVRATANRLLDGAWDWSMPCAELVKVVDFGLARVYPKGETGSFTIKEEYGIVGTPSYMAPEQAENVHDADIRSDLYSLGCTIYFALAGRKPFDGLNVWEILTKHQFKQATPLELLRPDVPAAVIGIIRKLMAKKPEHRFQTPAELLEALAYAQRICPPCSPPEVKATHAAAEPEKRADNTDHPQDCFETVVNTARVGETAETLVASKTPVDTQSRRSTPLPETLAQVWREWCGVIEALAQGRSCRVETQEYASLHKSLLKAIRSQTDQPNLLARLESLVEPWLSLKIIRDLDHRTRLDLWKHCQQIDAELFPAREKTGIWLPVLALIFLSLLSFMVFLMVRFSQG